MENEKIDIEAMHSKNQLSLFGYDDYFESFTKLIQKKQLPHTILFRGQKGIGKSTFAYHLINYILSKNEENQYSLNDLKINEENNSNKREKLLDLLTDAFEENINIDILIK